MAGNLETNMILMQVDIFDTIEYISRKLNCDVDWAITGGANFSIRTHKYKSNDIDIICDKDCFIYVCKSLFDEYPLMIKSISGKLRSYYCSKILFGVKIEIMSGVENLIDGVWVSNENIDIFIDKNIKVKNIKINLMSVLYEINIAKSTNNIRSIYRFNKLIE